MIFLALAFLFLILAFLETQISLRLTRDPERGRRWKINLFAFGCSSIVAMATRYFLIAQLDALLWQNTTAQEHVLPRSFADSGYLFLLRLVAEILILDLYLYFWHRLNHKTRFLWRFHQFHHLDPFLDVTTALRFHPCEIFLSQFFNFAFVVIFALAIGTTPLALVVFQSLVTAFSLFHHSNIKLPQRLETKLSKVIVTPRHHQNHHSWFLEETDSNYGVIFSIWDRLLGTKTAHCLPEQITIGVPTHSADFINSTSLVKQLLVSFEPIMRWPRPFLQRNSSSSASANEFFP